MRATQIFLNSSEIEKLLKKGEQLSTKTTIRKIAEIFFHEIPDQIKFTNNYYSTRSQINKNESSSSNSKKIVKFMMILAEKSLRNKRTELDQLINFLLKLRE